MAVITLLKLAVFTNDLRTVDITHQALAQMQTPTGRGLMIQYPLGFGQWLQALAYALSKPRETAILADPETPDTQALLSIVRDGCRPLQVVVLGAPSGQPPVVPLLQDRGPVDGQATAYVGQAFACQAPMVDPEGLQSLLETHWRSASSPINQ
jgi:uncharacterized protein YyaL (SSP411 family)